MSQSVQSVNRLGQLTQSTESHGRSGGTDEAVSFSQVNISPVRYAHASETDSLMALGTILRSGAPLHSIRDARQPLASGYQSSPISRYAWWLVLERDGRVCAWCHETDRLSMDHIVPLNGGGTNYTENLRPLCASCNSTKGHRRADSAYVRVLGCTLRCGPCSDYEGVAEVPAFCGYCGLTSTVPDWGWVE